MGAGSDPGGPTSHPAPCLWPGKAVKDGPKPRNSAPVWETWRKFLAPYFGLPPAVAVTWGVNHRMEDLPLYVSSSVYI